MLIKSLAIILLRTCIGLVILGQATAWGTQPSNDTKPESQRPRIGLVLSGGGARGAAHIGVLKVLEELRIPIDAIAATSMGAVVGGAYASGMPVQDMENLVTEIDWNDLFTDKPSQEHRSPRRKAEDRKYLLDLPVGFRDGALLLPKGAITGQKLDLFMHKLAGGAGGIDDFDQLPIPFRAVATDLVTGKPVVFETGDLAIAMRASMSVPGAIAPTEIGSRILVDGGLVRNLPVDIVRKMGVDVVIAVNLGTPLLHRNELNSFVEVTVQMIAILTEQNVQASIASLKPDDILILPHLGDITAGDFQRASEAIAIGVEAAHLAAPELRRYSLPKQEYEVWHRRLRPQPPDTRIVDEIRVEQIQRVNPDVVLGMLETEPGKPLDQKTLDQDIAKIYGHGDFERVNYHFIEEQGRRILVIDAVEKSWGPNYLRFGMGLSSDFQGDTGFNVLASYNKTWLSKLGAEWTNEIQIGTTTHLRSEFYKPLELDSPYFIAPFLDYRNRPEDIFEGDRRLAEYDVTTMRLGFDLGKDLTKGGELRLGAIAGTLNTNLNTGPETLPETDTFEVALTGRYLYDQLNRITFPTDGSRALVNLFMPREELGADKSYAKLTGKWDKMFSVGDHTMATGLELGLNPVGEIPLYDQLSLGGFLRLSGFRTGQLRGQHLGFGRLMYYQKFWELPSPLGKGVYAGGSLEAGNTWNSTNGIGLDSLKGAASLFLGADTILGPLFLGYGYADGGETSAYILLGQP